MDAQDKNLILETLRDDPDFEILEEKDGSVLFFDNYTERKFCAKLTDPTRTSLSALIHVMPEAAKAAPGKEWILDFLTHIDPAMLAGLSGIYVRSGSSDDARIQQREAPGDETVGLWEEEYGKSCGWLWTDKNAVVVNTKEISVEARILAEDIYPNDRFMSERERGRIAFEQFFVTLAHEIRHAAIHFPLTEKYCRIYGGIERNGATCKEDFYDEDGFPDNEAMEKDAEDWARDAFDKWREAATYGKVAREELRKGRPRLRM